MWDGVFSPDLNKSAAGDCSHGGTYVEVGDAEYGVATVYVQFNHSCQGYGPAPSNANTYTFEVQLDNFTGAEGDDTADLQAELESMSESDKLRWVSNNLVWE